MKILWLTNILLPQLSNKIGIPESVYGGWLVGLSSELELSGMQMVYVSPYKDTLNIKGDSFTGYTFCTKNSKSIFNKILENEKPDIVHIWGTEYKHTVDMVQAFGIPEKTIISIQGLVGIYALHYYASIPNKIIYGFSIRDLLKFDNVYLAKKRFEKNGAFEQLAIQNVAHVIGRTDWDEACVKQINPMVKYHFCNEILRAAFYTKHWSYDKCEKHSIFASQANYPLKGFHRLIYALSIIVKKYPEAKVYVTGKSVFDIPFYRITYYHNYIANLIMELGLKNNIIFTGILNSKEMCEQYLKSNVFVCPSSIENSPNSLGEAMLLGVPSVATDVGGIKNMLRHGEEGYLYQEDAPYMLAYYIGKIFDDVDNAIYMGENARKHAKSTHNRDINKNRLLEIYHSILK